MLFFFNSEKNRLLISDDLEINRLNAVIHSEGQSTARPPLFNGQYYPWWKSRIRDHIQGEDYELWDIVTDGPLATLKKNAEGVDVPKTRADCNAEDLKKWEKNAKAKKWLVYGLGPDEYNRIQGCSTARQIWDTLQVVHEGTIEIQRNSIVLSV
ncbi:uncharacterized protein [Nicotiana tomentosiformis]|uniref:uncharacterized protein n=1 Tax=Nicotiana tomentosiformis TaxID=4098 RepID=UPI00051CAA8E|nr:uncharacterized protein LOC117275860 [Nicotiana tomentosiformis]